PSPNALAIKDIRSQIDSYTGSGFLAKIEQGVKSDAIEQRKMEEERIERERQERIAREEQQRQQRLADLENQKRQMENEYYQMKSTGLKTPSKCQQAKAEYAQAEANMRQAANFSRGMGSFATGDAANAWNNTANAFDAGANVAETLKNAISIGCVMAGEGDFVDMANAIGNLNNSIQTLKSSSNSGSTYSAPSNPTSSAPDRCHCTLKRGNGISMDLGYINRSACTSSDVVTAICN
ncbi:MAG TPA: hypothetical protein PKC66_10925, partial [Leptospiraceae bacterium]|nr:hypothetical protein [Leptospiraceae bacterium]